MFVNKLLLAFVFYNNGKIIKTAYQASDLEAVNEIDNYAKVFLSYMVQKAVLQIHSGFCIGVLTQKPKVCAMKQQTKTAAAKFKVRISVSPAAKPGRNRRSRSIFALLK